MLGSSWLATGLVKELWSRLEGKDKRGQLAALAGVPAQNLSQMNQGKRPMTWAMAERLTAVVPGATPFDLGAPADRTVAQQAGPTVLDRLEELSAAVEQLADSRGKLIVEYEQRIRQLELDIARLASESTRREADQP